MLHCARPLPASACLALALSLAAPPAARAATVTVPGDFATLQEAVDAVQDDADPGEVVIASDGPFEEDVTISESVTLRADTGFTPVIQRLTGFQVPIEIQGSAGAATTVELRGVVVRASNAGGDGPGLAILIQNGSATELLTVRVDETVVEVPVGDQGIRATGGAGEIVLEVTESAFEVIGDGSGGPACIRVDPTAALTLLVTDSHLRFSRATGVFVQPGVDAPVFATIERNLFEGFTSETGSGSTGLSVGGPNTNGDIQAEVSATNNLFVRAAGALDLNGQAQNDLHVFFANNTAVGGTEGIVFAQSHGESTVALDLFNNVLVGSDGSGISAFQGTGTTLTVNADHQLLFDNLVDYDGIAAGPSDVHADPLFVDVATDDYRLAPGSPAIDAGDSTPPGGTLPPTDFDGSPRVADGDGDEIAVVDIGAFEVPEPAGAAGALAAIAVLGALRRQRAAARAAGRRALASPCARGRR